MTSRIIITGFKDRTKMLLAEIFEKANTMAPSDEEKSKGGGARFAQSHLTADLLGIHLDGAFRNPRGFENIEMAKSGGYYLVNALEDAIRPVHDGSGNHVIKGAIKELRVPVVELSEALQDVIDVFARSGVEIKRRGVLEMQEREAKRLTKKGTLFIGDVSDKSKAHLSGMLEAKKNFEEKYRYGNDEKQGFENFIAAVIGEPDTAEKKPFANEKTARIALERFTKAFLPRPKQGYRNIFERAVAELKLSPEESQAFHADVNKAFSEAGIVLDQRGAGTVNSPPM